MISYKELENECDRIGVACSYAFGGLLGVIRHGGYIPWDDDIDTMMIRHEFIEFKDHIDRGDGPENYWISDYSNTRDGNLVRKWFDSKTIVKEKEKWAEFFGFPFICNVDILIFDYLPKSDKDVQYYRDVVDLFQYLKGFSDAIEAGQTYDQKEFSYSLDLLQRVRKIRYNSDKDGPLSVWLWRKLDEFCADYNNASCDEIVSLTHYMRFGNAKYPKRIFSDYIDLPCEFTTVRVPVGYEMVLRSMYGDFVEELMKYEKSKSDGQAGKRIADDIMKIMGM